MSDTTLDAQRPCGIDNVTSPLSFVSENGGLSFSSGLWVPWYQVMSKTERIVPSRVPHSALNSTSSVYLAAHSVHRLGQLDRNTVGSRHAHR